MQNQSAMFKYLSEIISQFTSKQKILALLLLLVTITGITYITTTNKTPEEVNDRFIHQEKIIKENTDIIEKMRIDIRLLNDSIASMNSSCNKKIIDIENYYSYKMIEQQKNINSIISEIELLMKRKNTVMSKISDKDYEIISKDTVFTAHSDYIIREQGHDEELILRLLNEIKIINDEEIMP